MVCNEAHGKPDPKEFREPVVRLAQGGDRTPLEIARESRISLE